MESQLNRLTKSVISLLHDSACRARFRVPLDEVSPEDRASLLVELASFFRGAEEAAEGYVLQAYLNGEAGVYESLHGRPGVDHEMLEQAVEYAPTVKR